MRKFRGTLAKLWSSELGLLLLLFHDLCGVDKCRRPYRVSTHRDLHARPKPPSATKGRLKLLAHKVLSIATLTITVVSGCNVWLYQTFTLRYLSVRAVFAACGVHLYLLQFGYTTGACGPGRAPGESFRSLITSDHLLGTYRALQWSYFQSVFHSVQTLHT